MKRWALVVVLLYALILIALTIPVGVVAFDVDLSVMSKWRFPLWQNLPWLNGVAREVAAVFVAWPYWVWLTIMLLSQAALLIVPVKIAERRPIAQRSLLWPVAISGLMMGALATGAILALDEFFIADKTTSFIPSVALWVGAALWCLWTALFYRLSRNAAPTDVVSQQCRCLLKGSILELLIAVPTHVVARHRDYCCAGLMTFVGIVLGISVMLFSFGPAVFFLYLDRWNRLHPKPQIHEAG